jgi:hypothetical protein
MVWRRTCSGLERIPVTSCALTEHHAMKVYWESRCIVPRILNRGTRLRWVVSFTPQPLYFQGSSPVIHWIGGLVGPRAGLDAVVKRKIPSPCRDSNPSSYFLNVLVPASHGSLLVLFKHLIWNRCWLLKYLGAALIPKSRDSSVGTETRLWAGRSGS